MTELPEGSGLFPSTEHDKLAASDDVSLAAWTRVWADLGVRHAPLETFEELIRHYCEPHRAYHNRQHLAECLHVRQLVNAACQAPAEVDLALWFHDAIYDPFAPTTSCAVHSGWTTWHGITDWTRKHDAGFTTWSW